MWECYNDIVVHDVEGSEVRKSSPQSAGYHPRACIWCWVVGSAEAGLLTWHDKRVTVEMHEPPKKEKVVFLFSLNTACRFVFPVVYYSGKCTGCYMFCNFDCCNSSVSMIKKRRVPGAIITPKRGVVICRLRQSCLSSRMLLWGTNKELLHVLGDFPQLPIHRQFREEKLNSRSVQKQAAVESGEK